MTHSHECEDSEHIYIWNSWIKHPVLLIDVVFKNGVLTSNVMFPGVSCNINCKVLSCFILQFLVFIDGVFVFAVFFTLHVEIRVKWHTYRTLFCLLINVHSFISHLIWKKQTSGLLCSFFVTRVRVPVRNFFIDFFFFLEGNIIHLVDQ